MTRAIDHVQHCTTMEDVRRFIETFAHVVGELKNLASVAA